VEPSAETQRQIGILCQRWSSLELETERALLGVLGLDHRFSRIFLWKLNMRARWQMLAKEAPNRLDSAQSEFVKELNRKVTMIMRDRNIIVHGLVHMAMAPNDQKITKILSAEIDQTVILRPPCWTVFMGEGAGKSYLVSCKAVEVVNANMDRFGDLLRAFNSRNGFVFNNPFSNNIESNWPEPML